MGLVSFTPLPLYPRWKNPPSILSAQDAGWTAEPVWTLPEREKSFPSQESNRPSSPSLCRLYYHHYRRQPSSFPVSGLLRPVPDITKQNPGTVSEIDPNIFPVGSYLKIIIIIIIIHDTASIIHDHGSPNPLFLIRPWSPTQFPPLRTEPQLSERVCRNPETCQKYVMQEWPRKTNPKYALKCYRQPYIFHPIM
jgi:hypothetical protein